MRPGKFKRCHEQVLSGVARFAKRTSCGRHSKQKEQHVLKVSCMKILNLELGCNPSGQSRVEESMEEL